MPRLFLFKRLRLLTLNGGGGGVFIRLVQAAFDLPKSARSSAIKQEKVTAVTNVNFNVAVGTRIPGSVRFYPVAERVVAIYPEWRGYQFILVGSRYIIVEPETHEIVYIIES